MHMTPADRIKYKDLYIRTAREYLDKLSTRVSLLLQNNYGDENIRAIFISAHSLCSQSAVIGYENISKYASIIEKSFGKKEEADMFISDKTRLQTIQTGIEKLRESVDEIERSGEEMDLSREIEELEGIL